MAAKNRPMMQVSDHQPIDLCTETVLHTYLRHLIIIPLSHLAFCMTMDLVILCHCWRLEGGTPQGKACRGGSEDGTQRCDTLAKKGGMSSSVHKQQVPPTTVIVRQKLGSLYSMHVKMFILKNSHKFLLRILNDVPVEGSFISPDDSTSQAGFSSNIIEHNNEKGQAEPERDNISYNRYVVYTEDSESSACGSQLLGMNCPYLSHLYSRSEGGGGCESFLFVTAVR